MAAGYNRDGVVKLVGGAVQAVAVFKSDCLVLGLWMRGLKLGRQAAWRPGFNLDGVVKLVGGTVQAVAVFKSDCLVLGLWMRGLKLGRRAAWRPGFNLDGVVKLVGGTVQQLLCLKVTAWYLGSGCRLKLGRRAAWRLGGRHVERTPLLLGRKCRKFVVGGVEEASLVSTSAPLFVTYSRVNQWQICCAFVETVMLGHKSWCFRLFVDGLSTFRCH